MDATERDAIRRWASTRNLPPDIADQLQQTVPWIFGSEGGYAAALATEIMAEAMEGLGLSEDDVRSLGDWLSHLTDVDEPPLIPPQRLEVLDRLRAAIRGLEGAYLKVPWYAAQTLAVEVQLVTQAPASAHVLAMIGEAMSADKTIMRVTLVYPDGKNAGIVSANDA